MEEINLEDLKEKLAYYKKKVRLLEAIIQKTSEQKIKMAKVISKLLRKLN